MSNLHTSRLRQFIGRLPRGAVGLFARRVGVSRVYLSQLAAGQDGRCPAPETCVRIEREAAGEVRRWDMRPNDWHRIWPELIGAEGAPEVLATEARDAA